MYNILYIYVGMDKHTYIYIIPLQFFGARTVLLDKSLQKRYKAMQG